MKTLTKDETRQLASATLHEIRSNPEYVRLAGITERSDDYEESARAACELFDALMSQAYNRITLQHDQKTAEAVMVDINLRLARACGAIS